MRVDGRGGRKAWEELVRRLESGCDVVEREVCG